MANLDEPNGTGGGGGEEIVPIEKMSRGALEQRVRELEKENSALRLDIEALNIHVNRDAQLLHALMLQGIPLDPHEMEESLRNNVSLSDVIAEIEAEEGPK